MNDSKRASVTARIKTVAAVARARAEVRAGMHQTAREHELPDYETVRATGPQGTISYYGSR